MSYSVTWQSRRILCTFCGDDDGLYKCKECFGGRLHCKACIVQQHSSHPLHRIEKWNGLFFVRTSLRDLGLTVYLGHEGKPCPFLGQVLDRFTVVHTNGIHTCSWLPATMEDPQTAFTFDILNSYLLLSLQGKVSREDYYVSISRHTDNTGVDPPKDRYTEFLCTVQIWEHLMLLKRSGRGHELEGVEGTKPGQCAVECPVCPHPGRNVPLDWNMAPENIKWKYRLILTNKERNTRDTPALGDRWAHFVPETPYMEHVQKWGFEEQCDQCDSELRAIDLANSKCGGVFCVRHGLVRKNGLGNLQKGERYANMDFLAFYTLMFSVLTTIVFSYNMRLHIYAHGAKCQYKFLFNFQRWSVRTDGEDPERFWSHINPASLSTREMAPGARFDALDSHAAHWNWRKIVKLSMSVS
ncbi:hypothetical protein BJV77DRAFT_1062348 [Russula vinacea]|nr:hypothetical protein BJV77DRAFT_1062348 [Russula vinacea]